MRKLFLLIAVLGLSTARAELSLKIDFKDDHGALVGSTLLSPELKKLFAMKDDFNVATDLSAETDRQVVPAEEKLLSRAEFRMAGNRYLSRAEAQADYDRLLKIVELKVQLNLQALADQIAGLRIEAKDKAGAGKTSQLLHCVLFTEDIEDDSFRIDEKASRVFESVDGQTWEWKIEGSFRTHLKAVSGFSKLFER